MDRKGLGPKVSSGPAGLLNQNPERNAERLRSVSGSGFADPLRGFRLDFGPVQVSESWSLPSTVCRAQVMASFLASVSLKILAKKKFISYNTIKVEIIF